MSTTGPFPAGGDCGPEPEGAATTAASPGAGTAGAGAFTGLSGSSSTPGSTPGAAGRPGTPGSAEGQVEQVSQAGRTPQVAPSAQAGRTEQPGRAEQPGQSDEPNQSEQPGPTDEAPRAAHGESGKGHPMRQVRRLRLVGVSGAVPRARDFVRQALQDWGWLPAATGDQRAAAEDVLLVVSELVTNACLHADGPEELRVGSGTKVLRLEIVDQGSGSPSPRNPHRAGRPGGHGMFIVQRLCLDWGVVRNPEGLGKTVWAELAAPGS